MTMIHLNFFLRLPINFQRGEKHHKSRLLQKALLIEVFSKLFNTQNCGHKGSILGGRFYLSANIVTNLKSLTFHDQNQKENFQQNILRFLQPPLSALDFAFDVSSDMLEYGFSESPQEGEFL